MCLSFCCGNNVITQATSLTMTILLFKLMTMVTLLNCLANATRIRSLLPKHTQYISTVSCDVLNLKYTSRKVETLSLSLLYPNNLLNSFLFTHFLSCCDTPLCGCGSVVKSLFHVVFECNCSENITPSIN